MGMAESQDGKLRQEDSSQDSTAFMAAHTLLANTTHMAKFTIDGVGGYSLLLEVMGARVCISDHESNLPCRTFLIK